jgi:serine/threonine protein kinase HipA of HipAB toxin-antitoxin module
LAALTIPICRLLIVASDTALDHFVAVFVACHDERNDRAAAKAKRAERHHDDELQQLIPHRRYSPQSFSPHLAPS